MKRVLKKLGLVIILCFIIIVGLQNVSSGINDKTLVRKKYSKTYAIYDGIDKEHLYHAERYVLDGITAYCIEIGVDIDTDKYSSTNSLDILKINSDTLNYIKKVAYYGYDYTGHKTKKYYLAAQELIWEKITGRSIKWVNALDVDATEINVTTEKNNILNLIKNNDKLPSFDKKNIELNVNTTTKLIDYNDVLSNYEVYDDGGMDVKVDNNTLIVRGSNKIENNDIILKKKTYLKRAVLLYYNGKNQKMISAGFIDSIESKINIKMVGGKITINKLDKENKTTIPQGTATLNKAKYGVYNSNNELVDTIITGSNNTTKDLPYGSYTIKELQASDGYLLDTTIYNATIDSLNTNVNIDVYEQVIKNHINILKQYKYVDGNTTFLNAESDIKFEIYKEDNTLFKTIVTDENGYASINLPYGTWKFHQANVKTGYQKIYDFYITVNNDTKKEQYYNILNNKLSAYLQLFKIDSETGKNIELANTTFKILNTDTNKYVEQYVAGKVYDTFKTDEEGKFVTYLKLETGNYKIIEINSPSGYLINSDGLEFNIGDETNYIYTDYGPFVNIYFENEPIKGQIKINKKGESTKLEKGTFKYEEIPLDDVTYNIYAKEDILSSDKKTKYYEKDELVDTIITDENGYAISKKLYLGNYYLVEVNTHEDYVLDTKKYDFTLSEIDDKTPIVYQSYYALNRLKKGTLEFTKIDFNNGAGIPNTKIRIYNIYKDKKNFVFEGFTDINGKIIIKNLFVGKFAIVETDASTGYRLSDEIVYFEIKENGEIVKANMKNKKIKGTLEFTKKDFSTSEPLPNTKIEIYNDNGDLIYSGITDKDGKIIIDELEYGKYYIIEKEAPKGYKLSYDKMYFEIKNDGEVVKANMTNEKLVAEVPNTSKNDFPIFEVISLILIYLGAGTIIYAKIKK